MFVFFFGRCVSQESEKMTEAQFVKNHRGIDQGKDPPKELLEGMYRRIKVRPDFIHTAVAFMFCVLLSCFL